MCEWSPKPFSKGAPALSANAASEYLTQLDIINIPLLRYIKIIHYIENHSHLVTYYLLNVTMILM